tara:strand:+ start:412 stop:1116 length:705 start_codon:yes stop_codon:yes gene_type:complete
MDDAERVVDYDDFWGFLQSIQDSFLVYIDIDTAMECKNLGTFVGLVYREITENRVLLYNQELMRDRMIHQLAVVSEAATSEPFTRNDMNVELESLLRLRSKKDWTTLHVRVREVVGSCAGEVRLRLWSKVLAWSLYALFFVGVILIGLSFGIGFSLVFFLVGTILLLCLFSAFPKAIHGAENTLGQAIDQRIERLKVCQKGMSFYEVQSGIFDIFASWSGVKDLGSISEETLFP